MESLVGQKIGRYELVEKIGEGGVGVVYRATDPESGRRVAIKLLSDGALLDPTEVKRLQREARNVSNVDHPGIIDVYEFDPSAERPYLVMEYVEGKTITATAAGRSWRDKAALLRDTARALHFAHRRGLIHRDLKPENILVTEAGQPKILDFGIALARNVKETRLTMSGYVVGTPAYLSPEQARGDREMTHAADIFSLGVIMYEVLTGRLAFDGASLAATIEKILYEDPPRPREVMPDVPEPLERICLKALEKLPPLRYRTARRFADDLVRFIEDRTVQARATPPHAAVERRLQRHLDELDRWTARGYVTPTERERLIKMYERIRERAGRKAE